MKSNFHNCKIEATKILRHNQYPIAFIEPIIYSTINTIICVSDDNSLIFQSQITTFLWTQMLVVINLRTMKKIIFFCKLQGKITERLGKTFDN